MTRIDLMFKEREIRSEILRSFSIAFSDLTKGKVTSSGMTYKELCINNYFDDDIGLITIKFKKRRINIKVVLKDNYISLDNIYDIPLDSDIPNSIMKYVEAFI
ncbi:hypothetical protein F7O00_05030 [Campylobacter coli]|nr:hypothetical protein [Campylobacter coli]